MAVKKKPNGVETLKKDLQAGNPGKLYLLYGEEDYLKKHYLEELKTTLVDETFAEFNLVLLEGRGLTPEMLSEAVESYPAFAERKLVVVNDFDLYKPPAAFQGMLADDLAFGKTLGLCHIDILLAQHLDEVAAQEPADGGR